MSIALGAVSCDTPFPRSNSQLMTPTEHQNTYSTALVIGEKVAVIIAKELGIELLD
jgi:hypothetical protein